MIDYTPNANVTGGDVVVVGNTVMVAKEDIPANTLGALGRRGIYRLPKDNASAVAAMGNVYWNTTGNAVGGTAGAGAASNNATNTTLAGVAAAAQIAADATVDVILRGFPF